MTLHLVLDHSALIPFGDKPQEEKEAIRGLGDSFPGHDTVWYVSKSYLSTLYTIFSRELKHHHPLPKLHSSLLRTFKNLLQLSDTKAWWCRQRTLANTRIRLHVIARSALAHASPGLRGELESIASLSGEDLGVLAVAALSTHYMSPVYMVTTDKQLAQAVDQLARSKGLRVRALTPRQLAKHPPQNRGKVEEHDT